VWRTRCNRQQDILDDIVNQYVIGNLLANQHPMAGAMARSSCV
jgi:hypothetical protein